MSGFSQDDGFFQSGYYDNQNQGQQQYAGYDYSSAGQQQFGHDQQFGQFEYNQGSYVQEPSYSAAQQVYGGSIMTPATPFTGQQDSHAGDSYDDEPPLMEELGINFDHIMQKTMTVLNPLKAADHSIMQDTDLAGPLVFCLAFGGSLLLSGKVHFGYIYGIGVVGCLAMYCLLNLMSMTGVGMLGIVLTCVAVAWCSVSASKLFVSALAMDSQQPLVAYPCALVYGVFALITVF
ncbi:hypothetical protein C0Q70_06360 [Pomacea canaliculata]|uniref:Protein YIPF n=1 Tax=Pomacea canaliculata TaxID=400727 RepID=A0A2T7PNT5_POMCA|nr:hypothetical protein C0Q70_06360 [Pomacea canaliculata]